MQLSDSSSDTAGPQLEHTECFHSPVFNYERAFSFCLRYPWAVGVKEINAWVVCADQTASSVINTLVE